MSYLDLFSLKGKVAIVTGCKRGIGKGMAVALAAAGADIIGVSATLETEGSDVEREVRALGRTFKGYTCDFSDRAALYEFIAAVKSEFPVVDILINNAGSILRAPAAEHADQLWDTIIEINQSAQFILTREFGRDMVARGEGKIVFVASLLTFQGGINVPSYAASKGAVGQMTMAFANEWAGRGVNVNAIAPGYISTDNTAALRADAERSESILSRIPAGRWGTPEDFGGPVVFLSSKAADYMHGSIVLVDGGWMGR
ncbi:MAG: SDR family NAD(P)-dependent oxidoreductase [Rikenellaceae bacterium]